MRRWRTWLALACLAATSAGAQTAEPPPYFELWPELYVYYRINDELRTYVQLSPTFNPADQYSEMVIHGYLEWSTAPVVRNLLTNDETKERLFSMKMGFEYVQTMQEGSQGSTRTLMLRCDLQGRYHLPLGVLASLRDRIEGRRRFEGDPEYMLRNRVRLQLEREFKLGSKAALTPYANAEVYWALPGAFNQVRVQGGLMLDFKLFARGQAIDLNYLRVYDLREGKPDSNTVGLGLYFYF